MTKSELARGYLEKAHRYRDPERHRTTQRFALRRRLSQMRLGVDFDPDFDFDFYERLAARARIGQ